MPLINNTKRLAMKTIRSQIDEMVKAVVKEQGGVIVFNSKFYSAVTKRIKTDLPEHYDVTTKLVETSHIHTSKAGARTCHYLHFELDQIQFTDNQETKIDNYYQGGSQMVDPNIKHKPSKAEVVFRAAWLMANIIDESGTEKTYSQD